MRADLLAMFHLKLEVGINAVHDLVQLSARPLRGADLGILLHPLLPEYHLAILPPPAWTQGSGKSSPVVHVPEPGLHQELVGVKDGLEFSVPHVQVSRLSI